MNVGFGLRRFWQKTAVYFRFEMSNGNYNNVALDSCCLEFFVPATSVSADDGRERPFDLVTPRLAESMSRRSSVRGRPGSPVLRPTTGRHRLNAPETDVLGTVHRIKSQPSRKHTQTHAWAYQTKTQKTYIRLTYSWKHELLLGVKERCLVQAECP